MPGKQHAFGASHVRTKAKHEHTRSRALAQPATKSDDCNTPRRRAVCDPEVKKKREAQETKQYKQGNTSNQTNSVAQQEQQEQQQHREREFRERVSRVPRVTEYREYGERASRESIDREYGREHRERVSIESVESIESTERVSRESIEREYRRVSERERERARARERERERESEAGGRGVMTERDPFLISSLAQQLLNALCLFVRVTNTAVVLALFFSCSRVCLFGAAKGGRHLLFTGEIYHRSVLQWSTPSRRITRRISFNTRLL